MNVWGEVLTAAVMKSPIFWDIMSSSPMKFNRRFGGTSRLHLQGKKICQARNQHDAGSKENNPFAESSDLQAYRKTGWNRWATVSSH
jgi:hypothetical protein